MNQSNSNQVFEINGKQELKELHNLVTGFVETNQKVSKSGSAIMTAEIRAAKNLLDRIDTCSEDYLLVHENEVVFLAGKV